MISIIGRVLKRRYLTLPKGKFPFRTSERFIEKKNKGTFSLDQPPRRHHPVIEKTRLVVKSHPMISNTCLCYRPIAFSVPENIAYVFFKWHVVYIF